MPELIVPRPFQADMIQSTRAALRSHAAVMLQLPTGGGKTVVAASMMLSAVSKGGRPWFLCHRDFLVDQTGKTLERVGVRHGYIAAGRRWDPYAPAQVCSIDTLRNRLGRVPPQCYPTVVFVDEGHHACSATWKRLIAWALEVGAKVVGLSATPKRLDGKGLDELFGAMIAGPSVSWLIEQGYLSQYQAFAPTLPDLAGATKRGGDYKTEEMEDVMDKDELTGSIVGHYSKLAAGTRAVCFAVSVRHSEHIVSAFRSAGVVAVHLDANSTWDERRAAARGMAIGEIDVISNVGLFSEGYDLAAQAGTDVTIETVILARPTASLAMYMQQVGRALRPKDSPAIILDHAGNISRHGLPDDDREWTLEGETKGKKKGSPSLPSPRICVSCFATFAATASACPHCGTVVEREQKVLAENDGELVAVDKEALRAARAQQEANASTVEDFIGIARARGYAKPEAWAAHRMTARARNSTRFEDARAAQQKRW